MTKCVMLLMISLSVGYLERFGSGYPDSKIAIHFTSSLGAYSLPPSKKKFNAAMYKRKLRLDGSDF